MGTYVRTQAVEAPIGPSGRLTVRTTSADTTISATDRELARVRATFEIRAASEEEADRVFAECQLQVERAQESLTVSDSKGLTDGMATVLGRIFGQRARVDATIEVELPAHAALAFEAVSADLAATGLRGVQRYRTVSGDLILNDVGGEVTVNGVSGDVIVRGAETLGLRAEAVSGDLSALMPRFSSLRATSVSGDVEIEGAFDPAGEHRVDTVSGDLSVGLVGGATFEVRGVSTDVRCRLPHQLSGSADRRRVIVGDGGARVLFSSMSGDLSIASPRRLSTEGGPEPRPAATAATPAPAETSGRDELETLRALERGEIDVEEAARRLAGGGAR
jgi:hypothetical protein